MQKGIAKFCSPQLINAKFPYVMDNFAIPRGASIFWVEHVDPVGLGFVPQDDQIVGNCRRPFIE
jgi:hypothetical protein